MKAEQCDVVIIGGGLAGLTAAIDLSSSGRKVILIEKHSYPRHKVCGEYVSNEVLPYLKTLEIDIDSLNPERINKVEISTADTLISATLPLGGFGISRYAFDLLLYKKAVGNGCEVVFSTVDSINFSHNNFTVGTNNGKTFKAAVAIGAFGKRSAADQLLKRGFINKRSPWLAVKAHYKGTFGDHLVGLHHFEGGYCGVSKIEDGSINVCYLANYKTFKKYKNAEDYQRAVICKNPKLNQLFLNSEMIFEKPLTISQISFDKKTNVENHVLMTGDSAGLIHPLCGNGMAMAIHSAKIASQNINEFLAGNSTRKEMERQYSDSWKRNFALRMKAGRVLSVIFQNMAASRAMLKLLSVFPSLLPMMISFTHGKPIDE